MSVILETDEHTPREPEARSAADEEAGETDAQEIVSRRSSSLKSDQLNDGTEENVTGEEQEHAKDDTGGGGDTEGDKESKQESVGKEHEETPPPPPHTGSKGDSSSALSEKKSKSDHGSVSQGFESKKSCEIISRGDSQLTAKSGGTVTRSSSESYSSGFRIVTQILEELIDTVIKTKEEEEAQKQIQQDEGMKPSSVTTIKSEDDAGSLEIDPELQAQLALEQEAAALQRQQKYQENIALYHTLIESRTNLKHRNAFLLKQMYEHYKNKKIEHLFKEMPVAHLDMEGKYVRVLSVYEEAHKLAMEEEMKVAKMIAALEEKQQAVQSDLEEEYNNLISREREVAKGISATVTTKHLSAKELEILIQRQISKSKEVAKERLKYFKLRDLASADESHLKSLENLGGNYTLMEYEQLKMKSHSCVLKLEERDAELHRLRCKATSVIQVLSEIREKTHVLQEDIESGKAMLHDINQHLVQTRERVGCEKRRRDMSRSDAVRLRQEAGLLSEPKLLQDYKESLSLKETLLEQLEDCKSKFESQKQHIISLRRELALQQKGD